MREKAWAPSSRSARPSSRGVSTAEHPLVHETKLRVRYSETDAQRIVNNANYLSYFEVGRVEWLRAGELSYKELEKQGYGFVVVEAHAYYEKPAFFDDELIVRTELAELKRASLSFGYTVLRGEEVLVTGYTRHGCVELTTGKPSRIPEEFAHVSWSRS
ncbi:MAG: acyl-CoA thioesterase [Actinobacteria bacterium]|nr:acyl-CoA thioesterase [Actinomycetota bacterium]